MEVRLHNGFVVMQLICIHLWVYQTHVSFPWEEGEGRENGEGGGGGTEEPAYCICMFVLNTSVFGWNGSHGTLYHFSKLPLSSIYGIESHGSCFTTIAL